MVELVTEHKRVTDLDRVEPQVSLDGDTLRIVVEISTIRNMKDADQLIKYQVFHIKISLLPDLLRRIALYLSIITAVMMVI